VMIAQSYEAAFSVSFSTPNPSNAPSWHHAVNAVTWKEICAFPRGRHGGSLPQRST
jgi:hypothetical protein